MPFKDIEKKRAYDRQWMAKRRLSFFSDKKCLLCDSTDNLQLDHIDPKQKVTHRIWSWSESRRNLELLKCQVLCDPCHKEKTLKNKDSGFLSGSQHIGSKLNEEDVLKIRSLAGVTPYRQIAEQFKVSVGSVSDIINRKWWTHI